MLANAWLLSTDTCETIWQTLCQAVDCCGPATEERLAPPPQINWKGQQVEDSDVPCAQTMRGMCNGRCSAASCGLLPINHSLRRVMSLKRQRRPQVLRNP